MRYLLADFSNLFLRSYIVNPSLSRNGVPIGGVNGFLKSLQKIVGQIKPDRIVIVMDGSGGSRKRKQLHKEYKAGRKPIHLNRFIEDFTPQEEQENKIWQLNRLGEYFDNMPVHQLIFDGVEADDIVAHLCTAEFMKDHQKCIVSSDKDFYQLLDNKTIQYRPTQDEILNTSRLIEKHGIHPNNWALAKAIHGDKGDNIIGIPGIGLKTLAKSFPMLRESKSVMIPELVEYCEAQTKKLITFQRIPEQEKQITKNYALVQLYTSLISVQSKEMIKHDIETQELKLNKTEIAKMMSADGLSDWNWNALFAKFKSMVHK